MADTDLRCEGGVGPSKPATATGGGTRQITVKGIHQAVLGQAKEAAQKRGLGVSAWIRMQLVEAAERSLSEDAAATTARHTVDVNVHKQLAELRAEHELAKRRLDDLRSEINEMVRAQRNLMSRLLVSD